MVKDNMTYTVMLCGKGFVCDAHSMGLEFSDTDAWRERGEVRLKADFVQGLAENTAKNLGGTVVKCWFDNGAGGYFAEIEVA